MIRAAFFIISLIICNQLSAWQTLDLPEREESFQTGTEIIASIVDLPIQEREQYLLKEVLKGNVPSFLREMIAIKGKALIAGENKQITYYVIADYLALGSNEDYFLCPMTPLLAQKIADELNCILPTRKMVNQIWEAASVKMEPEPIPPNPEMATVPIFAQHNAMVLKQRNVYLSEKPLSSLVSGHKKDVVISNKIYGNPTPKRVVIYGWHFQTGKNIQPLYSGHVNTYVDYSHGVRLVQNEVFVNGDTLLATDILKSSKSNGLLSDEGRIQKPFYPDSTQRN